MECPVCKSRMGFVSGTCIHCGYNHYDKEFKWIEVDMEILEEYIPSSVLQSLIQRHERRYQ